jgi:NAD(P)-dependent dehydrogenase (short-subunit alcohol dehydrogenase family)
MKSARTDAPSQPRPPFPEQHQQSPGLITGGDSGIGRAVAVIFAREGADVAISYLPQEQSDAEQTRDVIEGLGRRCVLLPGDLTHPGFCRDLVAHTVRQLGKLDILVSNAAHQTRKNKLDDLSDEELERTFATNLYAYIRLARAALDHMERGSVIIATSSETGILGSRKLPDYSATKGAINAFTKSLAQDLIEQGIRVNAVAPGPVWTPLNPSDAGLPPEGVAKFGHDNPMGRPAQPEELAPAYVFLASNADSSYVTGTVLQVMGGESAGG